ncbi:efflux transporter, outer membrane factor (OMF) lipoprotein, NodT family [Granulicella pectinivorans]|uniref:Efflux transporter, outer membrane factor (OMF) lipoprotein, NodT family n=1 Tax=Granulicella pectinivorans TaxID=474950 RepID=A0A1I6M8P9_9BACT|nr:efflux transporter outer membrane subunit [Granulicella pectinivorans]SFS12085.1 efflux transporter, outer membrane factor (OMF) lipoprotein, NodT family [Granulicella pectinivorans]
MNSSRVTPSVIAAGAGLTLSLFLLTGCRVGPKYVRANLPAVPPAAYKENQVGSEQAGENGWRQARPEDAMLRGKWWQVFQNDELNGLEEQLNINNQNIKQYFENYMAARAVVRNAHASLYPSISFAPSQSVQGRGSQSAATTTTSTTGTSTTGTTVANTTSQSYSLPFSASWEPDLFGMVRNTIREDANAAQVSAANLANETLSEQTSLAQYYFELRGQDSLQELYNKTVETYRDTLRLTQTRYRTGLDSDQDVAQAETNLRTAEANAASVATTRGQYEHAIALLVGQATGNFYLSARPLIASPPYIPVGVPSQLLERRPDIAAAERTMAEANALIGIGQAAYYPDISLSASAGTQSSSISKLFNLSAGFWSLGSSATETIFDGGARRATVQQYKALYNSDVAAYRQTVLNAFKEVEDYLVASRQLAEQQQRQQSAIASAQRYQQLALTRYKTGVDTYLNVLTAQNSVFSSQETEVSLRTSRMTSAVQLIAALGGGWSSSDLPSEKEVNRKP